MRRGSVETRSGPPLTEREHDIARLVAGGLTNAEIAERLGITFATAKWHVSQVLSKLEVDSREAVAERLAEPAPPPRDRASWRMWSLAPLLKPLGIAAAVVPISLVAGITALVLVSGGGNEPAVAPLEATPTSITIVVRTPVPGAVITPAPQPRTCDWQQGQANMNNGPIDHTGCDFSQNDFGERGMMWNMAILRGANLSGSTIAGTFGDADFSGANLRGTKFVQAVFGETNFAGADLTGADFTNSILNDGDFTGAICPDGSLADSYGGTCLGTPGLRNLPTTRSFAPALAMAGRPAPAFVLDSAEDPGQAVSLTMYAARPVVLVWTASWCFTDSRCAEAFAEINAAAASHPNVAFLAVSLNRTHAEAVADGLARGFKFPVVLDVDMAASKAYNIVGPGLFTVIAPDGTVAPYANAAGLSRSLVQVLAAFD
jgi:DNA-binding CsgD family transcriptional regulator